MNSWIKKTILMICLFGLSEDIKQVAAHTNSMGNSQITDEKTNDLSSFRTRKLLKLEMSQDVATEMLRRKEIKTTKKEQAIKYLSRILKLSTVDTFLYVLKKLENEENLEQILKIFLNWNYDSAELPTNTLKIFLMSTKNTDVQSYVNALIIKTNKNNCFPKEDIKKEYILRSLIILNDKEIYNKYYNELKNKLTNINLVKNQEKNSLSNLYIKLSAIMSEEHESLFKILKKIAVSKKNPFRFLALKSINTYCIKRISKDFPDLIINTLTIIIDQGSMKYTPNSFSTSNNKFIEIIVENNDTMLHNLLLCKPGTLYKIGSMADNIKNNPQSATNNYEINSNYVLHTIPVIKPKSKKSIIFDPSDMVGSYPFVCTFPDHWRMMNGTLTLTE